MVKVDVTGTVTLAEDKHLSISGTSIQKTRQNSCKKLFLFVKQMTVRCSSHISLVLDFSKALTLTIVVDFHMKPILAPTKVRGLFVDSSWLG